MHINLRNIWTTESHLMKSIWEQWEISAQCSTEYLKRDYFVVTLFLSLDFRIDIGIQTWSMAKWNLLFFTLLADFKKKLHQLKCKEGKPNNVCFFFLKMLSGHVYDLYFYHKILYKIFFTENKLHFPKQISSFDCCLNCWNNV